MPQDKQPPPTTKEERNQRKKGKAVLTPANARSLFVPRLSPCVSNYLTVLADPFRNTASACVPVAPFFPSQREVCWLKGIFFTPLATSTFGFVSLCPPVFMQGDLYGLNRTSAGFLGSVVTAYGAVGVQRYQSDSQWTSGEFGANTSQARIVACGLRIRYTGTELNRGGRICGVVSPTHGDLTGMDIATAQAYKDVHTSAVDRNWHTIRYTPMRSSETDFTTPSTTIAPYMAFMVDAPTAGTSLPFEYEAFLHYEVVGGEAQFEKPDPPDVVGGTTAMGVVQEMGLAVSTNTVTPADLHNAAKLAVAESSGQMGASMLMAGPLAGSVAGLGALGFGLARRYMDRVRFMREEL